mgnify:FL=1|jgi:hypothetical protein|tara:strand:- start:55 stop:360 length:306 start_codon:yes stop_codon:yes gene_type:complete
MAKYGVILELSYVGKAIEESEVPIIVDALELEEVFKTLEEDMEIQIELEDFASQNYGELEFDAWKPIKIFQFTLTEDGDIDEDNEPTVVWEKGDGEVKFSG